MEELAKPLHVDIKTSGLFDFFSQALAEEITAPQKIFGKEIAEFFKSLLLSSVCGERDFILMDSTCIASKSEFLKINAKGFNRLSQGEKQMRLMYLFHGALKRPIYYRLINGAINDVKAMKLRINEADCKNAVFIADKGFYSADNVKLLDDENLSYIMPLKRDSTMIDYTPLDSGDFKKSASFFEWQGRIIFTYEYEHDGKRIITYRDDRLMVEEREDYLFV